MQATTGSCLVYGLRRGAGRKAGDRKGSQVAHTTSPAKDLGPKHKVSHVCTQMDNSGMIWGNRKGPLWEERNSWEERWWDLNPGYLNAEKEKSVGPWEADLVVSTLCRFNLPSPVLGRWLDHVALPLGSGSSERRRHTCPKSFTIISAGDQGGHNSDGWRVPNSTGSTNAHWYQCQTSTRVLVSPKGKSGVASKPAVGKGSLPTAVHCFSLKQTTWGEPNTQKWFQ